MRKTVGIRMQAALNPLNPHLVWQSVSRPHLSVDGLLHLGVEPAEVIEVRPVHVS